MELALLDADTGECYARFPVEEGSTFSVTFLHSVNKSDVCETYRVEGGKIYVESKHRPRYNPEIFLSDETRAEETK